MNPNSVIGVILAGGLARRMGGRDKALLQVGSRAIVDLVIERLKPQVSTIVLNANSGNPELTTRGFPLLPDVVEGFAGPLAGVLTGLEWTQTNFPEVEWIVTAAVDTPFFPEDLVSSFLRAVAEQDADLACASSNGRHHPVFGLWPVRLAPALREAITGEDIRKVDAWTSRFRLASVDFSKNACDPFFNVNRPEDLQEAERILLESGP